MVTVYTQSELEKAIENGEKKITCKGEAAKPYHAKRRFQNFLKWSGLGLMLVGLLVLPFATEFSSGGADQQITGIDVSAEGSEEGSEEGSTETSTETTTESTTETSTETSSESTSESSSDTSSSSGGFFAIGNSVLTAAEIAIVCGAIIALVGVLKGAKVTFNKDGSVVIEPQSK